MKMRGMIFAFAVALSSTHAMAADSIVYNSTPADGWFFGTGNNYVPANTAVLTTDANDQLYLRMHQTYVAAPASDGSGVYSFALGTTPLSFDWGIDTLSQSVSALLTLTNVGSGTSFSYDPFFVGNDNETQNGSSQNSFRLNWAPIGFDPNVNDTYRVTLDVRGLGDGIGHSLSVYAKLGTGAVPEPASWAMMIGGFALTGFSMRRRKASIGFA